MKLWPQRKDPVLHRALGSDRKKENGGRDDDRKKDDDKNETSKQKTVPDRNQDAMVDIHQLATKGRVRKKDKMKRNALHVAVRIYNASLQHTPQDLTNIQYIPQNTSAPTKLPYH